LALLGAQDLDKVAFELAGHSKYDIATSGIICLALMGDKRGINAVINAAQSKNELLRNAAFVVLAQYVDHPDAAKSIVKFFRSGVRDYIFFNLLTELPGWKNPDLLNQVNQMVKPLLESKKSFNDESIIRLLTPLIETDHASFKSMELLLTRTYFNYESRALYAGESAPTGSNKLRQILGKVLLQPKVLDYRDIETSEGLSSIRSMKSLKAYEEILNRCDLDDCEYYAWHLAQFEGSDSERLLEKTLRDKDAASANAAKSILEFRKAKDKDAYVKNVLDIKTMSGGKILYDSSSLKSSLLKIASQHSDGVSRELLEEVISLHTTQDVPWPSMTVEYLRRFGQPLSNPARFLERQKYSGVIADRLIRYLRDHPSNESCSAVFRSVVASRFDASTVDNSILAFIRMRQSGYCKDMFEMP
jgi:hypothetical protein